MHWVEAVVLTVVLCVQGGSAASWEVIRKETKAHLDLLDLLVNSIRTAGADSRRRSTPTHRQHWYVSSALQLLFCLSMRVSIVIFIYFFLSCFYLWTKYVVLFIERWQFCIYRLWIWFYLKTFIITDHNKDFSCTSVFCVSVCWVNNTRSKMSQKLGELWCGSPGADKGHC